MDILICAGKEESSSKLRSDVFTPANNYIGDRGNSEIRASNKDNLNNYIEQDVP